MIQYYYCRSYQMFNLALACFQKGNDIRVITSSESIVKACGFMKIAYLKHEVFNMRQIIMQPKTVNAEIERLAGIIGEDELHYSHTQFAVFLFILVDYLAKRGKKIVFHNFESVYNRYSGRIFSASFLKSNLKKNLIKLIYGLPLEIRTAAGYAVLSFDNRNIINNIELMDDKDSYYTTTLEYFLSCSIEYDEIENLFILQQVQNISTLKEEYVSEVISLFEMENVYVKKHPKFGIDNAFAENPKLPEYLPVELFFNKVKKNIISFYSASLITASYFNLNAISLLEIVGVESEYKKKVKKELTEKSGGKIIFPRSMEELKSML